VIIRGFINLLEIPVEAKACGVVVRALASQVGDLGSNLGSANNKYPFYIYCKPGIYKNVFFQ